MRVTISVFGRFHAFYLARELSKRGHLGRLITSYPRFAATSWGAPPECVRSLWPLEAARRGAHRFASALKLPLDLDRRLHGTYDRLAAALIPDDTDLFVGWSSTAERGIARAHELGAKAVVERCSSHIRTQRDILLEEYARWGAEPKLPHPAVVAREEREYLAADRVVVPSTFVQRTFLERGFPAEKLLRIPYGVDPDEFEPAPKKDDIFRVVFAGALGLRKGLPYLLQAFAGLGRRDSELLLLGSALAEAKPWLRRYGERVRHVGHIPQRELSGWYAQGSVFVLPSVEEGMAYVQLQAMACGLPLICTPHTGGEDLIREGEEGFVVGVRDVNALRDRLTWCYEHRSACREMGGAARHRVLSHFTWSDYGERIASAYRDVVRCEP